MGNTAALFDMDHTITWKNSGLTSVQFARRHGMVPTLFLLKGILKIALYRFSLMNIESWYERNMEMLTGLTLDDMDRFSEQWFQEMVRGVIYREAVDLIRSHKEKGHKIAIISNAPEFFVKPLATTLGIDDIICTRVEIKGSVLTGKLIKPLCYGEGKRGYAVMWARENNVDLGKSYFYTDSFYDIELMKFIGFPIAVNPDRKMKKAALQNSWPVLLFDKVPAF